MNRSPNHTLNDVLFRIYNFSRSHPMIPGPQKLQHVLGNPSPLYAYGPIGSIRFRAIVKQRTSSEKILWNSLQPLHSIASDPGANANSVDGYGLAPQES
ncbi:hypothetical protein M408DRAFT_122547 [Serendipita vermifera MAFF 305830]|uniref:Uncharacterized protein n=1 Tax=Serendipita vermifera MAFF 305830 TaxID=933852 RepID=A0A0C3AXT0_SERVB|nr:hypothetical protein M408DRAFT_122547 [Serendipita vermifera MAFF 305830]